MHGMEVMSVEDLPEVQPENDCFSLDIQREVLSLLDMKDEFDDGLVFEYSHDRWVHSIAFSPDSNYLASGGDDNKVKLCNIKSREVTDLYSHNDFVNSVCFSPDSQYIASGSYDNKVKLCTLKDGEVTNLYSHEGSVYSVAFSPDSKLLATGGDDNKVKLCNLKSREVTNLYSHNDWVRSVAFSPDSKLLATGGDDRKVKLCNIKSRKVADLYSHDRWVNSVAFSPDSKKIASGGADSKVKIHDFIKLMIAGPRPEKFLSIAEYFLWFKLHKGKRPIVLSQEDKDLFVAKIPEDIKNLFSVVKGKLFKQQQVWCLKRAGSAAPTLKEDMDIP